MSEWKEYNLGEIAHISTGFPFKGDQYESVGNLKVVRGENVTIGTLRWDSEKHWNSSTENLEKYFLDADDVVIGMDGSRVGRNRAIIRATELPLILAQRVARVRAKKGFDQKYLWYLIYNKRFEEYIALIQTGTSIPHISLSQIAEYDVAAPDAKEQTAIASILSSLDDKIDLLHRQNKTLEALAEALFRQWFVEEVDDSWPIVKISDVAEINSKTISKNYPFLEIEYLDTGSITAGKISEYQLYNLRDAPSRAQRIADNNDIVYSLVRPIQRHYGLLSGVKPNTVVSTGFCVISCRDFSTHFLYLLLTKDDNVEYFDMIAEGSTSTYPSLKPSDIAGFEFAKPPEEKLKKFSGIASDSWNKINSNNNQIRTLTQLRDNLLPKLMSGEVRVKM